MPKRRIVATRRRTKDPHDGYDPKGVAKQFVDVYAELVACDLDRAERIEVASSIVGLHNGHFHGGGH